MPRKIFALEFGWKRGEIFGGKILAEKILALEFGWKHGENFGGKILAEKIFALESGWKRGENFWRENPCREKFWRLNLAGNAARILGGI